MEPVGHIQAIRAEELDSMTVVCMHNRPLEVISRLSYLVHFPEQAD